MIIKIKLIDYEIITKNDFFTGKLDSKFGIYPSIKNHFFA